MNLSFSGKTAVVTGGAGGIGSVCVKTLLESDAAVAIVDVAEDAIRKAEKELSVYGNVKGYLVDITDIQAICAVIHSIREEMGEIGVLVQTAGLLRTKAGLELMPEEWDCMMDINAKGMFFMMQQTVGQSMQKCGGSIVNFSSMAGIRGMKPGMAAAHYSASKGAVVAMTMQAATEWACYGIRVNAVAPGGVRTRAMEHMQMPMDALEPIPLGRLSTPQDVANAAVFLASDKASMITGQTLVIDGGSSIVGY